MHEHEGAYECSDYCLCYPVESVFSLFMDCVFCKNNLCADDYRNHNHQKVEFDAGVQIVIAKKHLDYLYVKMETKIVMNLRINEKNALPDYCRSGGYGDVPLSVDDDESQRKGDDKHRCEYQEPKMSKERGNIVKKTDRCEMGNGVERITDSYERRNKHIEKHEPVAPFHGTEYFFRICFFFCVEDHCQRSPIALINRMNFTGIKSYFMRNDTCAAAFSRSNVHTLPKFD